ncbi:hypothetical protein [Silvibacterium dinghuense]|uniref:Uncharacterized protein n=1 Tax=Silvibacterium dinghuense TaxID=1560006 RepID=A0A4Q1SEY2_9BACT|nr:hypothetical protein [Silvibacterium dinghuense]RXS95683.1 hypothetical protein ESZ00_14120 [Silvibacterium dinghuense]GGH14906.1 hypothetical protein GCM10011586_35670 [Silvibacterium dinghuense]
MKKLLWLAVRVLVVAFIGAYIVDFAVFHLQSARGRGYDSVDVKQFLATPLKGNKAEYDYMGTQPTQCARAIFPHGVTPCWWLRRHASQWE